MLLLGAGMTSIAYRRAVGAASLGRWTLTWTRAKRRMTFWQVENGRLGSEAGSYMQAQSLINKGQVLIARSISFAGQVGCRFAYLDSHYSVLKYPYGQHSRRIA